MPTLHLLGTGAAVSDGSRTTTMLAIEDRDEAFLIDCGGDALQRAQAHGLEPSSVRRLFLTHEHADHISGFPLLMERLWLSRRSGPLPIHGPSRALDQARRCFDTFDTSGWDGLFQRDWQNVALNEREPVVTTDRWTVEASPGNHGDIDVIALRFEHRPSGAVIVYSADTQPSKNITRLAENADILVHEATGHPNHSTAEEAARVAAEAGAGQLVLVHLPPDITDADLAPVGSVYEGPAALGRDGDTYEL